MANDLTTRYWALYSNIHTFLSKGGTVAQAMTQWTSLEARMATSFFANLTNAAEA